MYVYIYGQRPTDRQKREKDGNNAEVKQEYFINVYLAENNQQKKTIVFFILYVSYRT